MLKIIVNNDRAINDDCHTNIQYMENANQRMKNKDNERKQRQKLHKNEESSSNSHAEVC